MVDLKLTLLMINDLLKIKSSTANSVGGDLKNGANHGGQNGLMVIERTLRY